jgi:hypothetical protein
MTTQAEERISNKLDEIQQEIGTSIVELLREMNKTKLAGKGKVSMRPTRERASMRWTLAWKQEKISYDLNLIVSVNDDGTQARVDRVWVHRHASSDYDFDGHTPTTRMRRLTSLSLEEIKQAIEAEFK